jgi:hypothetical protein
MSKFRCSGGRLACRGGRASRRPEVSSEGNLASLSHRMLFPPGKMPGSTAGRRAAATTNRESLTLLVTILSALVIFGGCASDEGGSSTQVSGGMYYGVGFYDPWYYGAGYYPPDVIVTPPPNRPVDPPHVEHPIARPPVSSVTPRPTPMPSIPSTPRPMPRR